MASDTPRTDAAWAAAPMADFGGMTAMRVHANKLELELAAAEQHLKIREEAIQSLGQEITERNNRVAELEGERIRLIARSNEWRDQAFTNLGSMAQLDLESQARGKAIESIAAWLLHRFGPGTPEAREAETALAALNSKPT